MSAILKIRVLRIMRQAAFSKIHTPRTPVTGASRQKSKALFRHKGDAAHFSLPRSGKRNRRSSLRRVPWDGTYTHRPTEEPPRGPPRGVKVFLRRAIVCAPCVSGVLECPRYGKRSSVLTGENRVRDFLKKKKKKSPGRGRCPRKSLNFTLVTTARV